MPVVQITILEGRTNEQKARLAATVTDAVVESIGSPRQNVRLIIHEVSRKNFAVGGELVADNDYASSATSKGTSA